MWQVRPVWAWPCFVGVPIHLLCKWAKVVCLCVCVCVHVIKSVNSQNDCLQFSQAGETKQRHKEQQQQHSYIHTSDLKATNQVGPLSPLLSPPLPGCTPFPFAAVCLQIYAVQANPHGDFCLKRFIVASRLPLAPLPSPSCRHWHPWQVAPCPGSLGSVLAYFRGLSTADFPAAL